MKLVLATRNQGKVLELTEMLRCHQSQAVCDSSDTSLVGNREPITLTTSSSTDNFAQARVLGQNQYEVISLNAYPDAPEVVEDGKTYMENAVKKASVIAEYTGYLALADDAGLEVDALNGAPGIHSKRWAGEDATDAIRIAKLLQALEGVTDRRARFVAAIAIVHPDTTSEGVLGVCEGRIRHAPVGESGFGYDPVFVPDGYDQTFAELGEEIKNQISHRAKALEKAREWLL
ncbi:RdgB/HAM1 family non-canonical purine NTP pyrophosphatase [Candidatus Poribacteria bacterium]|nr:RdgB/HAM1 family non-canonical purine NTP pyrophosphatase [Candidatus Poribacteria bacterium]MYG08908.1 RdgB/HAM1 family non-canonical purine NTP pyrophosphatase [Candidatus Poribacteria bacterium]MYK25026.1 RdgB/HAM1 family non-canonical purine NTP pyrophosphatase [Candidatus Poribacteria bacterium]